MTARVTEQRGPHVTLFLVRNRYDYGTIVVRPLQSYCGAEVLCNSSFGTFAHTWTHMGEDWRSFLADLDFEYAMGKMAGRHFRVPLGRDEFAAKMGEELDRYESDMAEWRALDAEKEKSLKVAREALEDLSEDVHPHSLFAEWDRVALGFPYELELYQTRLDKPCPQARGFWDTIWVPFMAHLTKDNQALERRWARELDIAGVEA